VECGNSISVADVQLEYFPQGTTISSDPDYLQAVADKLNDRPRRILGWRKPNEAFAELLTRGIASTG
jgi:IS30 family transposase